MTRTLRVLGLAMTAVLAISAMAASTAWAEPKFTAVGGAAQHLEATDVGAADKFTVGSNELTCSGETFTSEAPAGAQTTLQFTPNYVNCKTEGAAFNNVTVTPNGCTYTFSSTGPVSIDCPGTNKIEIHHYSSAGNHSSSSSSCTNTVGPQTAVGNATYTNTTPDVETHGTVTVTLQTHGVCSFGFTINQESTYHFSQTVKSTSGAHIHVG